MKGWELCLQMCVANTCDLCVKYHQLFQSVPCSKSLFLTQKIQSLLDNGATEKVPLPLREYFLARNKDTSCSCGVDLCLCWQHQTGPGYSSQPIPTTSGSYGNSSPGYSVRHAPYETTTIVAQMQGSSPLVPPSASHKGYMQLSSYLSSVETTPVFNSGCLTRVCCHLMDASLTGWGVIFENSQVQTTLTEGCPYSEILE